MTQWKRKSIALERLGFVVCGAIGEAHSTFIVRRDKSGLLRNLGQPAAAASSSDSLQAFKITAHSISQAELVTTSARVLMTWTRPLPHHPLSPSILLRRREPALGSDRYEPSECTKRIMLEARYVIVACG